MQRNKKTYGSWGEKMACDYLLRHGYIILEKNFRNRSGEIDIICKKQNYVIFTEVKTRSKLKYGYPREAVTIHKQRKIIKVALYYIAINNLSSNNFRFDVIEIVGNEKKHDVKIIENAFQI